jgi:hypothetical protein
MWSTLTKQFPNFQISVTNKHFYNNLPVAIDIKTPCIIILYNTLKYNYRSSKWVSSQHPVDAVMKYRGQMVNAEVLRQLFHWIKENKAICRIKQIDELTLFLTPDQAVGCLTMLDELKKIMTLMDVKVRAVDDSLQVGEKMLTKNTEYQHQLYFKSTLIRLGDLMDFENQMKDSTKLCRTLKQQINYAKSDPHLANTHISVSSSNHVLVRDEQTLTFIHLKWPGYFHKLFKVVSKNDFKTQEQIP